MRMCVSNTTCNAEVLVGVAYTPLFLLGLLVNTAALRAFVARRASWTDSHIYMLNLAAADFALILFLPFRIYHAFSCLSKTRLCTFLISTHYINMYASILTSTAISVHRCLAVKFPLKARAWRRRKEAALAVCLAIWALVVGLCASYCESNYPDKLWTCYERCKDNPLPFEFIVILVCLGFFIPLLIIVFCTSQIIYTLLKEDDKSVEKKNIVGIVTTNMIVFIVCYTPIHVSFLVNYFVDPPADWQSNSTTAHTYLLVSEWIATTNCCLDSISYYFLLKGFYS
ncbi:G-protein coupled receptor 35 [Centroberyx gerrardi]|uniref:G-protein coupled receptor 35-like n=1 Tax=Centroberyx gerrardi TaxID=166262 RepID=UPI003AAA5504